MEINTNGIGIFFVNVLVALAMFIGLLFFILRSRSQKQVFKILLLGLIVVVFGMTFSRITYGIGVSWLIFYGLPALNTFVLPPLVLRMSKNEILLYLPLAMIVSPVIHVFFSFFIGWHYFMPLFYVPYWRELFL